MSSAEAQLYARFWYSDLDWEGACHENGSVPITRIKHNITICQKQGYWRLHTQTSRCSLFMIFYTSRTPDTTKKATISLCFPGRKKKKVKQNPKKILQQRTGTTDTRGKSGIYFQDLFNFSFLHYNTSLKAAFTKTYFPSKSERQALLLNFNTSWWTWPFIPFPLLVDFLSTLPNTGLN